MNRKTRKLFAVFFSLTAQLSYVLAMCILSATLSMDNMVPLVVFTLCSLTILSMVMLSIIAKEKSYAKR